VLRYVLNTDAATNEAIFAVIAFFGVASMIVGNLLALLQDNIKRLLAYSSIAHIGYLTIALLALTQLADQPTAIETSLFYLAGYFAMTLAAFAVITLLSSSSFTGEEDRLDAIDLKSYEGLFWSHPLAATVLTLALLSLAGIPLTVGFIAKFYLILTGIGGALWVLVWALIIGSAIAIYYYLKVVITMTRQPEDGLQPPRSLALDALSVTVILGVTIVALGVYPQPVIEFVRSLLPTSG
jgi:NADH-quinone oxidoreductase subunit N